MKIEIIDPVECRVQTSFGPAIQPCLTYTGVYYRKERIPDTDRKRMVRHEYPKQSFTLKDKHHWYFFRGHLDRVVNHLKLRKINFGIEYMGHMHLPPEPYKLNGIKFRPDQLDLMNGAISYDKEQNGVIVAPTGTGKTILQLGLRSAFPKQRALILTHTIDIVQQTVDECRKFGFDNVQQIGGGKQYDGTFGDTVVSTIQSFCKIEKDDWMDEFPIVIVDEAHHVTKFDGTYAKVLRHILAPVRIGFTATLPTQEEAEMALEGLIGPVIGEQTINEATELGILAEPKVRLLKSPFNRTTKEIRRYPEVYEHGIINNYERNRLIVETILKHKERGEISLIFVNRIEHGKYIAKLFKMIGGIYVPLVQGDMKPTERKNVKQTLLEGKRKVVIATTAWKEGINIPSLNVIFNAGGGKDELPVLQTIGRGLRRTDEKDRVTIYDFFDPSHHYLISHFGQRITLYMEHNWI
jgi:superfamily II DNA or RNA helicase